MKYMYIYIEFNLIFIFYVNLGKKFIVFNLFCIDWLLLENVDLSFFFVMFYMMMLLDVLFVVNVNV